MQVSGGAGAGKSLVPRERTLPATVGQRERSPIRPGARTGPLAKGKSGCYSVGQFRCPDNPHRGTDPMTDRTCDRPRLLIVNPRGFCAGVERAIEVVEDGEKWRPVQ